MAWQACALRWLVEAGMGGLLLFGIASLALRWVRQPAQQLLLIEWTFAACIAAPLLHAVPGMPKCALDWLPVFEEAQRARAVPAIASGLDAPAPDFAPPNARGAVSRSGGPRLPLIDRFAWLDALLALYAAGALTVLSHWCLGMVQIFRVKRTAATAPAPVHKLLFAVAGPGARRALLLSSSRVDTPITFGWRRPVIVLPEALCRRGDDMALRYALAHEWSHVERRDVMTWQLTALVQILYFYLPLFWRLRRRLRLCQDYLADRRASQQGDAVEDYADYLVAFALGRIMTPPFPALAFSDRRSDLYRRVVMLVERREKLEFRSPPGWQRGVTAAAILLALGASTLRLEAGASSAAPASAPQAAPAAYHGRVTDYDTGRPIEGAMVVVRRREAAPGRDRVLHESLHRTDSEGQYSFSLAPEHLASDWLYLEIDVEHPQYAPKSGKSCSLDGARRLKRLAGSWPGFAAIRLRRGEEATATVETIDGRPIEGIEIVAYSQADGRPWDAGSFSRTKTDAEGRFRVVLASSGDSLICLIPSDAPPLLCVVHQQRGDLGRFRVPVSVVQGKPPVKPDVRASIASTR